MAKNCINPSISQRRVNWNWNPDCLFFVWPSMNCCVWAKNSLDSTWLCMEWGLLPDDVSYLEKLESIVWEETKNQFSKVQQTKLASFSWIDTMKYVDEDVDLFHQRFTVYWRIWDLKFHDIHYYWCTVSKTSFAEIVFILLLSFVQNYFSNVKRIIKRMLNVLKRTCTFYWNPAVKNLKTLALWPLVSLL